MLGVAVTPTIGISNYNDDTTPPVTTISFDPPEPDGLNGWYVTPVIITFIATDDMSGVNTTYYSINSGSWRIYPKPYHKPLILTEEGFYYIVYFSVDNAGNMEFPKLAHIKIDQTSPFVNLTVKNAGGGPLTGWDVLNTAIAFDNISGMNYVEFYLNDYLLGTVIGPGPIYQWIFKYSHLIHVIKATAYDQAGLRASAEVTDFKIIYERFVNRFPLLRLILQPIINIMCRGMKYA